MALPSTGAISIADVVVYRRAAGASKPWAINQNSGFNNMNSYRGSAWVNAASWDASIANTQYDSCYAPAATNLTYSVTNTTSLFGSAGNVYSVSIVANSGYYRTEKGCNWTGNAGATSIYIFQNAPAGTYKVAGEWSSSGTTNLTMAFQVGTTTSTTAYLNQSYSNTGSTDALTTFTLSATASIRIALATTSISSGSPALYGPALRARIIRVS